MLISFLFAFAEHLPELVSRSVGVRIADFRDEEIFELVAVASIEREFAEVCGIDEDADAVAAGVWVGIVVGRITEVGAARGSRDISGSGEDGAFVDCAVSAFDAEVSSVVNAIGG
jgi:hypothetical protein